MPSELFVQVPSDYGDLRRAGPGTPLLKLMKHKHLVPLLLHMHLLMVLYCQDQQTGPVLDKACFYECAYPCTIDEAERYLEYLAEAGFIELRDDGTCYVPAVEQWGVLRTGTRDPIPDYIRMRVYDRDGRQCVKCGSGEQLTLDHIHPWSLNGPDSEDNLQTLCGPCNNRKRARV